MSLLRPDMHVHLVGIGGIGLSAIARVLHGWGYRVSGSDRQPTALTGALAAEGIVFYAGHQAGNVTGADLVVVSSAVPDDNPEVVEARERGVPVVKRNQFLADLTAGKITIAVAGTHGKTTTSAMIAWILVQAGLDPTFIVGGVLHNLGTNARAGCGPHFVIEADEYDRAFLGLWPRLAVITTIEHDHPDCYPTLNDMRAVFAEFAAQVTAGADENEQLREGVLIVNGENREARELGESRRQQGDRAVTYGLTGDQTAWDWQATGIQMAAMTAFDAWHAGHRLGTCVLHLPGRHNVLNALAALAATTETGLPFETAAGALAQFRGTARRFEVKGQAAGVTVIDDYAHHPTEIRATLAAAQASYPRRAIWAIFQPHTYSRTQALLGEFGMSFGNAHHVIVTGVYAAREADTLGVSGADVADRIRRNGHADVYYVESLAGAAAAVLDRVQPGDVVLTLGAGDGYLIGEQVLKELRRRGGVD
jgi:UDP-N-acetylmuramate--alanine ligase